MAWDDRMHLRELTPDEAEQLKDHPQVKAAIRAIKILRSHTMLEG